VKTVSLGMASIRRKLYVNIQKIEQNGAQAVKPNFYNFLQFTENWGHAQRNGFYYPILVFFLYWICFC